MTQNTCERFRPRIARALFDDLPESDLHALRAHVERCETCRSEERELRATVGMLKDADDVSVPRHFFVPERATRQFLSPFIKGAVAALVLGAAILAGFLFGTAHVRVENGVLMASLGSDPGPRLESAWSDRVLGAVDRRLAEHDRHRAEELERFRGEAAAVVSRVLHDWEGRIERRIDERDGVLRHDTHQAMLELYRTVDDRWRHDMSDVSLRLDRVATHNLIQDERTEAMASVLLAGDGPSRP